jgi:shikimate dehydrogenase
MPPKTVQPVAAALPITSPTLIEKCCLIAQPVAGNPTHFMVEQALALAGLDWRFMSFEVAPERLDDAIRGIRALGFRGVKVAEPFQETVLTYLDDLTERARQCGSVNCVTYDGNRLVGDNTEGIALVELLGGQAETKGRQAMILGTGRLARALATELVRSGISGLNVVGRSLESGRRFVELIRSQTAIPVSLIQFKEKESIQIDPAVTLLINATSLGTFRPNAPLPLEAKSTSPGGIVVDVTYNSPSTWLTSEAAKRGCHIIEGVDLFVRQTALALSTWTGAPTDLAAMRDAAEEFLGL